MKYRTEGDQLLTEYEWAGGIRIDPKTNEARRREIGQGTAFAEPMPARGQLAIAPAPTFSAAMEAAAEDRNAQLLRLRLVQPLGRRGGPDAMDLGMFDAQRQPSLF